MIEGGKERAGGGLHRPEKVSQEEAIIKTILEKDLEQSDGKIKSERKKSKGTRNKSGTERKRKSKKIKNEKRKKAENSKSKTEKNKKKGYRNSKKNTNVKGKKSSMDKNKKKGGKKVRAKKKNNKKNLKKSKLKKRVKKVGRLGRPGKKKASSNQSCDVSSCLYTAGRYLTKLQSSVLYFKKQKIRIERFIKIGQKKGNKSEIFKPLLSMLREAGKAMINHSI